MTIELELFDSPLANSYYQLKGQSAYIQYQTAAWTTGGQLDGYSGPGFFTINYTDIFPPLDISDYEGFSYFGLVDTIDTLGILSDTSFVMAFNGTPPSANFEDYFLGLIENDVVDALSNSFDSPEFFSILNTIIGDPQFRGAIELPDIGTPGEILTLYAFQPFGGSSPNAIGTLKTSIVIPEPSAALLGALGSLALLRRRRAVAV